MCHPYWNWNFTYIRDTYIIQYQHRHIVTIQGNRGFIDATKSSDISQRSIDIFVSRYHEFVATRIPGARPNKTPNHSEDVVEVLTIELREGDVQLKAISDTVEARQEIIFRLVRERDEFQESLRPYHLRTVLFASKAPFCSPSSSSSSSFFFFFFGCVCSGAGSLLATGRCSVSVFLLSSFGLFITFHLFLHLRLTSFSREVLRLCSVLFSK